MTGAGWWCVETASGLLEPREREAVLGDLAEAGNPMFHGLLDVLGLALRRQMLLWKSWRPWVSAFGVALPNSFQLMGFSLLVSEMFQHVLGARSGMNALGLLFCRFALLVVLAWSCGFAVGAVSRRTLWVSVAACFFPCLFCLSRFKMPYPSPLSLLLFLPFALWGTWQGLRRVRLCSTSAVILAVSATVLAIVGWPGPRIFVLALIWPGWFLVATARRRPAKAQSD
jgi:hypothetical protein